VCIVSLDGKKKLVENVDELRRMTYHFMLMPKKIVNFDFDLVCSGGKCFFNILILLVFLQLT
jgi:hypothetical protein